ncbi:SAM-dependent methyltransferase [Hyphomicrobium sp.]|uniref:SAM-dependent methyltransferase n=1 Tax=Hyphomicrobium sp. TaxID=82 RepID=UPI003F71EF8E
MPDEASGDGLIPAAIRAIEKMPVPDAALRLAVRALVGRRRQLLVNADPSATATFARAMAGFPIAAHTDAANAQHYDVPAAFFELVLGPQRKYSCCLYPSPETTLEGAEEAALCETARHAALRNGQTVLELGCGWGAFSLWMARHYPASKIVSVSNSNSQRAYIEARAAERGIRNLRVVTADANVFAPSQRFDRVVSVEMFEHISNWAELLARVRTWMAPDGLFLLHVFAHSTTPYRFDHTDPGDWVGQHFFTGGLMPSERLIHEFSSSVTVEQSWRWGGEHYARTAEDWLRNFDRHGAEIRAIFEDAYGADAPLWQRRWRVFFLATAGLFGHRRGNDWGVNQYLLRPAAAAVQAPSQRVTAGAGSS